MFYRDPDAEPKCPHCGAWLDDGFYEHNCPGAVKARETRKREEALEYERRRLRDEPARRR